MELSVEFVPDRERYLAALRWLLTWNPEPACD